MKITKTKTQPKTHNHKLKTITPNPKLKLKSIFFQKIGPIPILMALRFWLWFE
jgi:hypothetical protein